MKNNSNNNNNNVVLCSDLHYDEHLKDLGDTTASVFCPLALLVPRFLSATATVG